METRVTAMLEPSAEFRIHPSKDPFLPARSFVVGTQPGCEVCIAAIFEGFKRRFLSNPRWTLEPHGELSIRILRLTVSLTSSEILERLTELATPEIPLSAMFQILRRQPTGQQGPLSTSGFINVFFVRDPTGLLQTVRVHWFGYGWYVESYPMTRVIPWREGAHIAVGSNGAAISGPTSTL